jgi:hypothetical protein
MPISVIGPKIVRRGATEEITLRETFSQSTATTFRSISKHADITILAGGTGTDFQRNLYSLASGGEERREKFVYVTGTGQASLFVAGTATGLFVLSGPDDFVALKYMDGKWRVLSNTATVATAT